MKFRNDNRGLSLVEMLASVAILSIVMAGAFYMLSVMSKSFQQSQTEVELQNTVQSTYNIVSDFIQEAQKTSDGNCIEFDGTTATIYTQVNSISGVTSSDYYTLTQDENNLYLGKNKGASAIVDDEYLLARNVGSYNIDLASLSEGYVVLTITCQKGARTSTISQNVYLRNANGSANITGGETNETEGYELVSITEVIHNTKYKMNSKISKNDFSFKGNWQKESDIKELPVPNSMVNEFYLKDDADKNSIEGTNITGPMNVEFSFTGAECVANTKLLIELSSDDTALVNNGAKIDSEFVDAEGNLIKETTLDNNKTKDDRPINTNIEVSYYLGDKWTEAKYKCNKCGTAITKLNYVYYPDAGLQGYICPNASCVNHNAEVTVPVSVGFETHVKSYDGPFYTKEQLEGMCDVDGTNLRCKACGMKFESFVQDGVEYYYLPKYDSSVSYKYNSDSERNLSGFAYWMVWNSYCSGYQNTSNWKEIKHRNDSDILSSLTYEEEVELFEDQKFNMANLSDVSVTSNASSTKENKGTIVIKNISEDTDYHGVKVVLYIGDLDDDTVKFKNSSFTLIDSNKTDDVVTLKVQDNTEYSKFVEIDIGSLPSGKKRTSTDSEDFSQIVLQYSWTGNSNTTYPIGVWARSGL